MPTSSPLPEYLAPELRATTMDSWLIRSRILEAVREELPRMKGVLLDLGCGVQPYRSIIAGSGTSVALYVGVDIQSDRYHSRDVTWDGAHLPFASASIDFVLATELLEHCPNPPRVLDEMARVLKPGGRMLLTVPFLWPLHDTPYDEYRYTSYALQRMLGAAGFADVEVRATGGWDASLAQLLGLWVRRRPMGRRRRAVISRLLLPVYRRLVARDDASTAFGESVMLTGLTATAAKGGGLEEAILG